MSDRLSPAMLALIRACSWRGYLPERANRATMRALFDRDLIDRAAGRRARWRLTDRGRAVRDNLPVPPISAADAATITTSAAGASAAMATAVAIAVSL